MRPSAGKFTSPSGPVDKKLAPMWRDIERVVEYLPQISHVSYYLESLFNLDRNLSHLYDQNIDHDILKDITIFQGASAYELALVDGYSGTLAEWLATLVGPKGDPGVIDEPVLNQIQHDIVTNANNIQALETWQATVDGLYVSQVDYDARAVTVDGRLDNLEDELDLAFPVVPSDSEIATIAQERVDTAVSTINDIIDGLNDRFDLLDIDFLALGNSQTAADTAFAQFLVQNDTTLTRVTTLEAVADSQNTLIANIQDVSADYATNIDLLEATTATHSSQILAVQQVSGQNATNITTLITQTNGYESIIAEIQQTSEDQAIIFTTLQTTVDGFASDISDVQTTTAQSAATVTALNTRVTGVETDIVTIDGQLVTITNDITLAESSIVNLQTTTTSQATDITSLFTRMGTAETDISGAEANIVSLGGDITALQGENTTQGTNITSLLSRMSAAESDILGSNTSITDLLSRMNTAEGDIDGAESSIATLNTTTSGQATSITALTSRVTDTESDITTAQSDIVSIESVNSTQATDISALNTSVGAANAAITLESSTRASETASLASRATNLESTTAGHTASINTNASAITDINGNMAARYAIRVNAGGFGAFVSLEDGTTEPSTVTLSASQIRLDAEDIILDGTIKSANIGDLEVDTIKIAGGAVSDSAFSASTGGTASISHAARQGSVLLHAIFYPTSTSSRTVTLKRGATTLRSFTISSAVPILIMYVDNPPASTTYTYTASGTGGFNATELLLLEVVK